MIEFSIHRDDVQPEETWRLLDWCASKGADEFTVDAIRCEPGACGQSSIPVGKPAAEQSHLLSRLESFSRGVEQRPILRGEACDVPLWSLNRQSVSVLRSILRDGLFTYACGDAEWLEDVVVFRHAEVLLGIITHGSSGDTQLIC
jgi:hypothetical protein